MKVTERERKIVKYITIFPMFAGLIVDLISGIFGKNTVFTLLGIFMGILLCMFSVLILYLNREFKVKGGEE